MKNGHRHFQVGHPAQPRYTAKGASRRIRKAMRRATDSVLAHIIGSTVASLDRPGLAKFLKRSEVR